jgi:hypothetical protein
MAPEAKKATLQLPVAVVTKVDIGRLLREVEALNNFLNQSTIRKPGEQAKPPKTSRLMDEIITINKLNVLVAEEREQLYKFLEDVRKTAPILHMSFNSDPAPMFMRKLTTWLRNEIHPYVLVQIGLQPNIGAGCILRTTNKYFDFSLKQHFLNERGLLMESIAGKSKASSEQKTSEAAAAVPAVQQQASTTGAPTKEAQ